MSDRDTGGVLPVLQNLHERLQTLDGAMDVYSEVIDRYAKAEIGQNDARTLGYLLAGLLNYFKFRADMDIEQRIEALEQRLERKIA